MKTLYIIRGIPGSGKSTFANQLPVDVCVAADDFFMKNGKYCYDRMKLSEAHTWCFNMVKTALENSKSVAVHNVFLLEEHINPYLKLADDFDYQVFSIVVENRHGDKSIHDVPTKTINNMTKQFEIQLVSDPYENLVRVKKSETGLYIHKYKSKVFYNNLWHLDQKLLDARGLVLDDIGTIVQYPFTKIFNYKENGTMIEPNHLVRAFDKINGFMAAVTIHNGEILVSTTGSLDSQYVDVAKELLPLPAIRTHCQTDVTYCFEIVHPNDPHIIAEKPGAYLIGGRHKIYGSKQLPYDHLEWLAGQLSVPFVDYFVASFSDVLEKIKTYKREGFVVYDLQSDTVLKLKSPYYLASKFIARTKRLDLIFRSKYKQVVDEEFYPLCEFLQKTYSKDDFLNLDEQVRLTVVRNWADNHND